MGQVVAGIRPKRPAW
ncbi:hypothetical protein [Guyparkeria sp.]